MGIVCVSLFLLGMIPLNASSRISEIPIGEQSRTLYAYEVDYWWICDVIKGDLVTVIIKTDAWPSWKSRIYYPNLTMVENQEIYEPGTHVHQFIADMTGCYLLRIYADFTFNYTTECTHPVSEVPMDEQSGALDAFDCWWVRNVTKGDVFLLSIQTDAWPSWESRIYFNLTLTPIDEIYKPYTHVYEFIANETGCYRLEMEAGFTFNYTIKCTHPVRIQGDIDGDGDVDYRDLFILARAYGCITGQPCYHPLADLVCNGKIDYRDLFTLARNYGRKEP